MRRFPSVQNSDLDQLQYIALPVYVHIFVHITEYSRSTENHLTRS